MVTNNAINVKSAGIVKYDGSSAFSAVTTTQYNTLIGAASNGITSVAPSATSGVPLVSGGASANPAYGTALVAGGGTGSTTFNAYGPVVAGATTTTALTSVVPTATAGIPLVSGGSSANPSFTTAVVAGGGTGGTTQAAYSVICGGTTTTAALQNVSGLGSAGQVLTSAGASALPAWGDPAAYNTWTPTIYGSTSAGSATYVNQVGVYLKIGRLVHLQGYLLFSNLTGTGDTLIGGLPFAALNVSNAKAVGSVQCVIPGTWAFPTDCTALVVNLEPATQYLSILAYGNGGADSALQCAEVVNCAFRFSITYITA